MSSILDILYKELSESLNQGVFTVRIFKANKQDIFLLIVFSLFGSGNRHLRSKHHTIIYPIFWLKTTSNSVHN